MNFWTRLRWASAALFALVIVIACLDGGAPAPPAAGVIRQAPVINR